MIYPSMASLLKKVDSRYTLVIAASKRARMLTEGAQKLTDSNSSKDVTIAINEISEGKVGYHRIYHPENEEETFMSESVTTHRPSWESRRQHDEDDVEWSDDELVEEDPEEDLLDDENANGDADED